MFKNLFKRLKRKRILKIIKKAKKVYLCGYYDFMCPCFMNASSTWWSYEDIVRHIPEFKPSTFGVYMLPGLAWWDSRDRKSRIKAFDKLIEIYSK